MQIVIDIPEDIKVAIEQMGLLRIPDEMQKKIDKAIQHSTPLPKNHGDLVDRDDLLADSYCIDDWSGNEISIVDVMTVEMADAIIEADTESEDKE